MLTSDPALARSLSRRGLLTAGLSAASLAALAACGQAEADPATGAGSPAASGSASDAFPVTITHEFGETVIPAAPQRVATLGVTDADALLALGGQPLITTGFAFYPETGTGPWATSLLKQNPVRIESDTEADIEKVAAAAPDLIIAIVSGIDEAMYTKLSAIAPTIARPKGSAAYDNDRDSATTTIAAALGKKALGDQLVADADRAFTDAIAANPAIKGRTGIIALPYDGKYGAFTPGDGRGQFMADLGFTMPDALAKLDTGDSFFIDISPERLELLEADVLVILTDPETQKQVDKDKVFAQLDVVKRGSLVNPSLDVRGAITYNSVLSVPWALERIVPDLVKAANASVS